MGLPSYDFTGGNCADCGGYSPARSIQGICPHCLESALAAAKEKISDLEFKIDRLDASPYKKRLDAVYQQGLMVMKQHEDYVNELESSLAAAQERIKILERTCTEYAAIEESYKKSLASAKAENERLKEDDRLLLATILNETDTSVTARILKSYLDVRDNEEKRKEALASLSSPAAEGEKPLDLEPCPDGSRVLCAKGKCVWSEDEDGNWETECGQMFNWIEDGPTENGARFCLHCGKALEEKKYTPPECNEE